MVEELVLANILLRMYIKMIQFAFLELNHYLKGYRARVIFFWNDANSQSVQRHG